MDIHEAVQAGRIKFVERLIADGVNINALDYQANAPIHYAAALSRPLILELLLEKGADVNIVNQRGFTPLDIARKAGRKQSSTILLNHNAIANVEHALCKGDCFTVRDALTPCYERNNTVDHKPEYTSLPSTPSINPKQSQVSICRNNGSDKGLQWIIFGVVILFVIISSISGYYTGLYGKCNPKKPIGNRNMLKQYIGTYNGTYYVNDGCNVNGFIEIKIDNKGIVNGYFWLPTADSQGLVQQISGRVTPDGSVTFSGGRCNVGNKDGFCIGEGIYGNRISHSGRISIDGDVINIATSGTGSQGYTERAEAAKL